MKYIPLFVLIVLALLACNLTSRKTNTNGGASATGGEAVERPQPTDAQLKALAGGQTVKWEQQDISWTLPPGWNKMDVDSKQFNYGAPGNAAFLIGSISLMDASFPTEISLKAFYDGANTRKQNGE